MRDRLDQPFSQTVRAIGEGLLPPVTLPDASVVIPLQYSPQPTSTAPDPSPVPNQPPTCSISGVDTFQQLIDFVYPDILTAEPTTFANRGILAPTNNSTDEINDHILGLLPARMHTLHSANTIIKTSPNDINDVSSVEFLQSIDVTGVPPHDLNLKVGCVVMFIRNVNFDSGIVNGRKGIVQAISSRIVDVEIIGDGSPLVRIPRITFEVKVGKDGMTFHRKQFPLRVCYAMTINKSQGQTLSRVGLHLRDDVFCHGQLYVALSRTTSCSNIVCLVKPERIINGVPHVANSVYEPFITAATGRTLPVHSTVFYRPPTWPSANPSSTSHQSQHATSSTSS